MTAMNRQMPRQRKNPVRDEKNPGISLPKGSNSLVYANKNVERPNNSVAAVIQAKPPGMALPVNVAAQLTLMRATSALLKNY
jgi:hypothetical protein